MKLRITKNLANTAPRPSPKALYCVKIVVVERRCGICVGGGQPTLWPEGVGLVKSIRRAVKGLLMYGYMGLMGVLYTSVVSNSSTMNKWLHRVEHLHRREASAHRLYPYPVEQHAGDQTDSRDITAALLQSQRQVMGAAEHWKKPFPRSRSRLNELRVCCTNDSNACGGVF